MADQPLVSVIIPTKDRQKELAACLRSVFAQSYKSIEVIVIDNASSDNTATMLKRHFPDLFYICNKKNIGASRAKNQGIKCSKGKYLWFLDSDSRADNLNCLKTMIALMEKHKDIGSLGGELINISDNNPVCSVKYILMNGWAKTEFFSPEEVVLKECDYCATANCFLRREDILRLGGFDPEYFYLCEDTEIGYRLKRMGKRVISDYRVAVFHDINLKRQRSYYLFFRNSLLFGIKNFPIRFVLLLPFSFLDYKNLLIVIKRFKKKDPGALKYFISLEPGKAHYFFMAVKILFAIIAAYVRNIIFLPRTLLLRRTKKDFLDVA